MSRLRSLLELAAVSCGLALALAAVLAFGLGVDLVAAAELAVPIFAPLFFASLLLLEFIASPTPLERAQ